MPTKIKKILKKQGFTLVELIIVVAIIAVLSIAALMMLTKWLASSRDSRRLSDVSTIQKALEIDYTVLGHYPDPDGKKDVLDMSGNLMWYMGYIGEDFIEKIDSLNKAPVDPSDSSNYNYAVTLDNQEYQLGALLENGEEVSKFLNNTYAIQKELTENDLGIADIEGNYDGIVSYTTDSSTYIIKTESLLVRSGNYVDTYSDDTDKEITTTEVTNLLVDGKRIGEPAIIMDINIPNGSDNDRAIRTSKTELGLSGDNIEGDKQAIIILEDNTKEDYVPIQYKHCTLGSTEISHGYTIDTYSSSTVPFDNSCEDIMTTRLCDNGTLSDGPNFQSCIMEGAVDCELNGAPVGHGDSITAYLESNIAWNASYDCDSSGKIETRNCYNGSLDGSFSNLTCAKGTPENCDANSSYSYNGHTYNVPALTHDESDTPTINVSENNGTYKYTLSVTCNDGTYNESETGPVLVSCDTNYEAKGNNCEASDREQTCSGTLASNEEWNTSDKYTQTWDGSAWAPIKSANYDEIPSLENCAYRCKTNYTWNGSSCDANTKSVSCSGTIPTNATAGTATTYTQTWNGSDWAPTISWTEGASTCGFSCNANYTWNGTSCEADGRSETCGGSLPSNAGWNNSNTYGQIWNGSDWEPTKTANYSLSTSSDDCRYACLTGNHTEDNGTTCVSNTRSCAITNGTGSQDWEGGNSGTASDWGTCMVVSCDTNYTKTGNTCAADVRTVDCGGTMASNSHDSSTEIGGKYDQTWDGSTWLPVKSRTEGETICGFSCDNNFTWNGSACIADTKTATCSGSLPANAEWNSSNNYVQTRNTITWAPTKTANYNITTSTDDCRYRCKSGYHTENGGTTCVANTRTCTISNGTGSQTWNGSSWSTCSVTSCGIDFYSSGGSCIAVGNGYYSTNGSTTRTACTNHPDTTSRNYTYTSDGNGTNSCAATYTQLCGVDLYETSNGTCSAVGNGYYSAANSNTRTACSNYPDTTSRNYTYTSDGNGTNSCAATYTQSCGVDFYETANGTCTAVGIGYYSAVNNNTRTACSNYPDTTSRNYTYTSDGNGANSCAATYTQLCGVDLYETANGTCSAVGIAYYSAANNNTRTACSNKPTNSTYTSDGNGTNACTWSCNTNYTQSGSSCIADTKSVTCSGTLPSNSEWNTSNTYTQTWNGTAWAPTKTANYNVTSSTDDCRYTCSSGYHTENGGTSCISNTKTCSIPNGTGQQTWGGSSRGTCTYVSCNAGYGWDGSSCSSCTITSGVTPVGDLYKFTSGSSTFTTSCDITVDLLVVGGGGGAGRGTTNITRAAPGGGGGVIYNTNYTLPAGTYSVVVGAGGAFTKSGASSSFGANFVSGGGVRGSGVTGGRSGRPQANPGASGWSGDRSYGAGGSAGPASGTSSGGGISSSITGTAVTYGHGGSSRYRRSAGHGAAGRGNGGGGQGGRGGSGVVVVKVR